MTRSPAAMSVESIPNGWDTEPFGAITTWMSGGTPSKGNPEFWDGTIPWISAKSLKSFYLFDSEDHVTEAAIADGARLVEAGDILMLVRGMTLHNDVPIGIAMRPMTFNQDVKGIRADGEVDTRFIAYWLVGNKWRLLAAVDQASHGTGRLRTEVVKAMDVLLPPLNEQRAIATVLGSLDDKIEQNRRTARALERLARAIFKAWFVDFEPVKAKVAGAASFPSMPQEVFDALPTAFADSEIGPLPEGWEVGCVKDATTLSKAQIKPQDHPIEVFENYSIPAFDAGHGPQKELGEGIKSGKHLVVRDCVLVSKLNPRIPRVWIPHEPGERRQIASTEFLVLSPREGWDRSYLYCQFTESGFREDLTQSASGTSNSHQRVRPRDFMDKAIVSPPAQLRQAFRAMVAPMMHHIAAGDNESRKLAEMRDFLLPKLLSGEVRVCDESHSSVYGEHVA